MDIWVDVGQGDDSNSGGTHQTALMTVREAVRRAEETPPLAEVVTQVSTLIEDFVGRGAVSLREA